MEDNVESFKNIPAWFYQLQIFQIKAPRLHFDLMYIYIIIYLYITSWQLCFLEVSWIYNFTSIQTQTMIYLSVSTYQHPSLYLTVPGSYASWKYPGYVDTSIQTQTMIPSPGQLEAGLIPPSSFSSSINKIYN